MEALINQAFLHVDVIGQHVHEGHYDLVGPDGEIILPQVYESMVKPDWAITMHMWPMPDPPRPHGGPPGPPPPMPAPPEILGPRGGKKDKHGKKSKGGAIPPPPMAPPGAHMGGMMGGPGLPPPPPPPPGMEGLPPPPPDAVHGVMSHMGPPSALPAEKKKKKKAHPTGFLMWTAGGPSRNQSLKSGKKPESNSSTAPASERATPTTRGGAAKADRPSAPNGRAMPRPSAPNGKAEGAGTKAGEEQCVVM
jgi:hypothetical protein